MTKSPYTIRAAAMLRRRPNKSMLKTIHDLPKRAHRDHDLRDFTPIEQHCVVLAGEIDASRRMMGVPDASPEDTIFADELDFCAWEIEDERGPANAESEYTGI